MEQSTTGQPTEQLVADNSSTTNPVTTPAENTVEETSTTTSQATDTSAEQNNQAGGEDADLANFAKGQGITDLSELSDREKSLLKMARDNKSAFDKTKQNQPKLDESSNELTKLGDDATDVEKLSAKVANMEFSGTKAKFFEGKDVTLEPTMAKIVAEKRTQFGDDYARSLLQDLPTLYGLAQLQKPTDTSAAVEAARQEERTSINKSLQAGGGNAQAISSKPAAPVKVTNDWIRNEYNPSNPEHVALLDAAMKK